MLRSEEDKYFAGFCWRFGSNVRVAYPIVCPHSGCLQRKLFALIISRRDLGEGPWAEPVQTDCFVDEVIKGINDNITVFDLS